MGVLAWMGASGAQLQLQSALSARHTLPTRPRHPSAHSRTVLLLLREWQDRETTPKANTALLPLAAAVNQAPPCVPSLSHYYSTVQTL